MITVSRNDRPVAAWLLACAFLVFCTLIIGGATRLTHSGLSIVEWKPVTGVLPPLTDAAWAAEFAKYQGTPEFEKVNHGMSVEDFKGIFWWEWAHRLSGRLIGAAFALPFLFFLLSGRLARGLAWKLAGIFVLGGAQGAMGWYMVKSGLVDDPRVSHFRLTAHLSLAFVIFIAMVWVALGLLRERVRALRVELRRLQHAGTALVLLVGYMVVTGGFVAGIRAGKAYNTFPLMNGHVLPPESFLLEPWYMNAFNNMALVQFDHRVGAWLLALVVPWLWWRVRCSPLTASVRPVAHLLLAVTAVQVGLGISTLLLQVPVVLGTAHQGGAMVLMGVALWFNHALRTVRA